MTSSESPEAPLSWDEYFMLQAMMASFRSKDPSTKVGSVLVDQNNHQISMGYNGFIAGIDESQIPWTKDLDKGLVNTKYGYVVHAEANAILHSPRSLENSRCYVTLFPCNECAKLIASKKVGEVIYLSDKHQDREHTIVAKKIFELAGINFRQMEITDALLKKLDDHLKKLLDGVRFGGKV
ncbi:MAG: dCMP deaminase family protein [Halobacteriovoraceae bacterium]|nr:dCMP deaminase family protein [Halobacteriovoraceae bacterium]